MSVSPQHFTVIDGLRFHFRLRGAGEPLVLLHGWRQTSLSFATVLPALEKHFRVLAPDLPGFGFTAAPPATWGSADYAQVLAALMEKTGFAASAVLGHSFGGKVAVALASQRPDLVSRLVLVAAPVVGLPASAGVRSRSRGYALARRIADLAPPLRERILEWARNRYGSEDYKAAGELRPTFVRVVNEDWRAALSSIRAPVLLVYGQHDPDVAPAVARAAHEELPDSKLVMLETGHFPFLEDRDGFIEKVTEFLVAPEAPRVG